MNKIDKWIYTNLIDKYGEVNCVGVFILFVFFFGTIILAFTTKNIEFATIQALIIAFGGGILIRQSTLHRKLDIQFKEIKEKIK